MRAYEGCSGVGTLPLQGEVAMLDLIRSAKRVPQQTNFTEPGSGLHQVPAHGTVHTGRGHNAS